VKNIALITVLFDYPLNYNPVFYKNALKFFNQNDIHVVRYNNIFKGDSYYDKLYFYKVVKLLEYIENNIKNKYRYILFLDATDTNFYSSPENIIQKFEDKKCSIIMGAEKCLWPPHSYTHLYDKKNINSEYKYLNSGTYFGYTESIFSHLKTIIENEYDTGIDDQGKWTIQYLLNDDIIIDHKCEFFMSTLNSKQYIKIINNTFNIETFNPIIVHDNGPHNNETIKISDKL
jgi:hypothetical protein